MDEPDLAAAPRRRPARAGRGGEGARLSLALALVGRPEVVCLDEPTAGVDPEGRIGVRRVIAGLRDRGACVLCTTHELGEAERVADRVVIVHHGRMVAEGTPAELAANAVGAAEVTFGAPAGLDVAALGAALGAGVTEEAPGRYRVAAGASPALTATLAGWLAERELPLTDLRTGRSLEEAYLSVVGDGTGDDAGAGTGASDAGAGTGGADVARTGSRSRRAGSRARRPGAAAGAGGRRSRR